jgi:predicted transcriptional regulator
VESYSNFVFATDRLARKLGVFMVDETDLENDDETIKTWETQDVTGEIRTIKFIPS